MGEYIAAVRKTDEKETPDLLFWALNHEFHFTRDVCASADNYKVLKYWTIEDDAMQQDWSQDICWLNPPYSRCGMWVKKAYEESQRGATVVCLVPSATDTRWWHEYAAKGEVRFCRGRIRFKGTRSSAPFPSALVIFRPPNPSTRVAQLEAPSLEQTRLDSAPSST